MFSPIFLSVEDIIFIHKQELSLTNNEPIIRDYNGIIACTEEPKSSFNAKFLYKDLFEMAVSYLTCFVMRHPFLDGNKRVALAAALIFLYLNGKIIKESHHEELANLIVNYIEKRVTKEQLIAHLRYNSSTV